MERITSLHLTSLHFTFTLSPPLTLSNSDPPLYKVLEVGCFLCPISRPLSLGDLINGEGYYD